jgi:hypothetical protein
VEESISEHEAYEVEAVVVNDMESGSSSYNRHDLFPADELQRAYEVVRNYEVERKGTSSRSNPDLNGHNPYEAVLSRYEALRLETNPMPTADPHNPNRNSNRPNRNRSISVSASPYSNDIQCGEEIVIDLHPNFNPTFDPNLNHSNLDPNNPNPNALDAGLPQGPVNARAKPCILCCILLIPTLFLLLVILASLDESGIVDIP